MDTNIQPLIRKDDISEHRDEILKCMMAVCVYLDQLSKKHGDVWNVLSMDFAMSIAAINQRPDDIPTILAALMCSVKLLGDAASQEGQDNMLSKIEEKIMQRIELAATKLIEIHGHQITEDESRQAVRFIESMCWDTEQKEFVSKA